jgi:hypothetical protein
MMVGVVDGIVAEWVGLLASAGVQFAAGLSDAEFDRVQQRFGFTFGVDHRRLLAAGLSVGEGWVNWRETPEHILRGRLSWPADGVVFDVWNNDFWPAS